MNGTYLIYLGHGYLNTLYTDLGYVYSFLKEQYKDASNTAHSNFVVIRHEKNITDKVVENLTVQKLKEERSKLQRQVSEINRKLKDV